MRFSSIARSATRSPTMSFPRRLESRVSAIFFDVARRAISRVQPAWWRPVLLLRAWSAVQMQRAEYAIDHEMPQHQQIRYALLAFLCAPFDKPSTKLRHVGQALFLTVLDLTGRFKRLVGASKHKFEPRQIAAAFRGRILSRVGLPFGQSASLFKAVAGLRVIAPTFMHLAQQIKGVDDLRGTRSDRGTNDPQSPLKVSLGF